MGDKIYNKRGKNGDTGYYTEYILGVYILLLQILRTSTAYVISAIAEQLLLQRTIHRHQSIVCP